MDFEWTLFDLDGTLVDTREIHIRGLVYSFQRCLGRTPDLSGFDAISGKPFDALLEYLLLQLGVPQEEGSLEPGPLIVDLRRTFSDFYYDHLDTLVKPFNGITELLSILHDRGFKLALVSSKRRGIGERELNTTGLSAYFPIKVFLNHAPRPKPFPEPIYAVMQLAGLNPGDPREREKLVMVGDSLDDMLCAWNAGICSVQAAWKWNSFERSIYVPRLKQAGFVVYNPLDLLSILASSNSPDCLSTGEIAPAVPPIAGQ